MDKMVNENMLEEAAEKPEYITVESDGLTFRLEIFEGPLDLLLSLIAKNKVNIYDIPIALILDQYMEYIRKMDMFDLEIASEFIVMAAQLMVIKSRMLLPRADEEQEDPRKELVDLLLEYKRAKMAADILHDRELTYAGRYEKPAEKLPDDLKHDYKLSHDLSVLTEAYRRVYERNLEMIEASQNTQKLDALIRTTRHVSVSEKINGVLSRVSKNGSYVFSGLFDNVESRSDIVATFLAVLELVKSRQIIIEDITEDYAECRLIAAGEGEDEEAGTAAPDTYEQEQ